MSNMLPHGPHVPSSCEIELTEPSGEITFLCLHKVLHVLQIKIRALEISHNYVQRKFCRLHVFY